MNFAFFRNKPIEIKMEKLEGKLNIKDLESLQDAFMVNNSSISITPKQMRNSTNRPDVLRLFPLNDAHDVFSFD